MAFPVPPRALVAWLSLLLLTACASPAYYYQAAAGHLDLMRSRQDIDAYLAEAPADDPLAIRLAMALEILDFADQSLDLPAGDSYQTFADTDRDAVTWNVIATPEFSLQPKTWCFAVAGCVPYRGYFNESAARDQAEKLNEKGLDVTVMRASAYSTLGWFDDPLLDTMLEQSDAGLSATLIHELAHQKVYIKGDTRFNESYASFVGRQGTMEWLEAHGEAGDVERWLDQESATADFQGLLQETRSQLDELYRTGGQEADLRAAKKVAFGQLRLRYAEMVAVDWEGKDLFGAWFTTEPNNADLALMEAYQSGECAFQTLFADSDRNFSVFHQQVAEMIDWSTEDRALWLDQTC